MALYFFAMYFLGGSLGPVVTGRLSDHWTRAAAAAAGVQGTTPEALVPFRGAGLASAMQVIPILGLALAAVLLAGAFTVRRDMERLRLWMLAAQGPGAGAGA
jgi:hypothetical protein